MKRKLIVIGITFGILALGGLLALLVAKGFIKLPCLFHELTGLQCPGCGNTRATMALLRRDLRAMLGFNLLYPLQVFYVLRAYIICARNYIRGGRFAYPAKISWFDISCLSLFLLWAIVRNFTPLY